MLMDGVQSGDFDLYWEVPRVTSSSVRNLNLSKSVVCSDLGGVWGITLGQPGKLPLENKLQAFISLSEYYMTCR